MSYISYTLADTDIHSTHSLAQIYTQMHTYTHTPHTHTHTKIIYLNICI